MKPLSISSVALATALLCVCSGFRSNNPESRSVVAPSPVKGHEAPRKFITSLYWYTASDDTYDTYTDWMTEAGKLQVQCQCEVDDSPYTGIMVMEGYVNNWEPHLTFPSIYLYANEGD